MAGECATPVPSLDPAGSTRLYPGWTAARYARRVVNGQHGPGTDPIPAQREGGSTAPPPLPAPAVGSPPPATVPVASGIPGPAAPRRRKGRILLILAIVVASLVVLGGIAGVVVYGQATKIDRSTPTVVARQFLQAALVEKDVGRVGLFVCGQWPAVQALAAADPHLDPAITVAWGITSEQLQGRKAQVVARVTFSLSGGGVSQRSVELWTFDAVQENGWRICALSRGPSLGP
jgi:hypothetical protein